MRIDITFHYPPELMNLLVDTIPLLNRGKKDIFLFFRGAGISDTLMQQPYVQWQCEKNSINKYEIVREVLTKINECGEGCLRERREVLKRVVEFDNFSSCWANDQLKAKGLVAEIRNVVNVKDTFTRINQERNKERQERIKNREAKIEKQKKLEMEREQIKNDLYALFNEENSAKRGTTLENVLNRLFKSHDILIREAFARVGEKGEGIVEQIDGVIEIDGHIYLVEMKWTKEPVGVQEVSHHLVRVYHRGAARGILISYSGYTDPAIAICKEALQQSVFVLTKLQELILLLEHDMSLLELLKTKVQAAVTDKQPYTEIEFLQTK